MIQNQEFIEKIKTRGFKNLKIHEVYSNTILETEVTNYLKKQNYLQFSKIEKILKNQFILKYPYGYAMKNPQNDIVGFMGAIFSIKKHGEKKLTYCNIHTWIVDNQYRLNSFLLLTPLLEKEIVLTAFTPVKSLVGLLEKFGFKKIKMQYRITFLFDFLKFKKINEFKIERDNLAIRKILNKSDLEIYENYINLPYEKFTIIKNNDSSKYIFVIASKVKKKVFQVLNLFYVSDNAEMKKNWNSIKAKISKEFNLNFCGQYFFNEFFGSLPNNLFISKNVEKNVCIKNLDDPNKLDILYSDLIG